MRAVKEEEGCGKKGIQEGRKELISSGVCLRKQRVRRMWRKVMVKVGN